MRAILSALLAVVLAACSAPDARDELFEARTVVAGKVGILVPRTFVRLDERLVELMYPGKSRPNLVLTDERATVHVAMAYTKDRVAVSQVEAFQWALEDHYRTLYPTAEWLRSEVTRIHNRPFIVLELRTPSSGTRIHSIILGTSLDDRMFLITFSVAEEWEDAWMAIGRRIMDSVEIHEQARG